MFGGMLFCQSLLEDEFMVDITKNQEGKLEILTK